MAITSNCVTGDRFDLGAIAEALHGLRRHMGQVNRRLDNHHQALDRDSVNQIVQAYSMIDHHLTEGLPLLSMGQSRSVLAVNHCVLFGMENSGNPDYCKALKASERHFYGVTGSGIGDLLDWYSRSRDQVVWDLAAGVYLHTIGPPQLFLEGNHRTGVILANYVLGKASQAPLVIDHRLAPTWFEVTEKVRSRRRSFLEPRFWLRSFHGELADLIQNHVNERYLRSSSIPGK
ncbi:hypothetical protein ACUNV4_23925 [Granulosicoccus sp. 3-233]|uniref:hypothetical protein n=1 Tax=Granulosicoccus sp. 3-233 TaxID=3417969 RepID=UPI003D3252A8